MISRFRTFIAGFLVLLPLAVTLTVIVWVGTFIYAYIGPDSAIGRVLISIGFNFSNSPIAAYALGAVVVVGLVYLLGLVVESRLESRVRSLIDSLMQRIPFVGNLYDVPKPIMIDDRQYHVVLVPSAPVPVGGCLVYVPVEWVRPADFGVEALMSIYVSMGVTTPQTVDGAPILRS